MPALLDRVTANRYAAIVPCDPLYRLGNRLLKLECYLLGNAASLVDINRRPHARRSQLEHAEHKLTSRENLLAAHVSLVRVEDADLLQLGLLLFGVCRCKLTTVVVAPAEHVSELVRDNTKVVTDSKIS